MFNLPSMIQKNLVSLVLLYLVLFSSASAQNRVVVVPLGDAESSAIDEVALGGGNMTSNGIVTNTWGASITGTKHPSVEGTYTVSVEGVRSICNDDFPQIFLQPLGTYFVFLDFISYQCNLGAADITFHIKVRDHDLTPRSGFFGFYILIPGGVDLAPTAPDGNSKSKSKSASKQCRYYAATQTKTCN